MSQPISRTRLAAGRSLVTRWRILTQRRLDYLTELQESGRWKLYHSRADFLEMLQEARTALKTWEKLAPPDRILDKTVEVAIAQQDDPEGGLGTARALPRASLKFFEF